MIGKCMPRALAMVACGLLVSFDAAAARSSASDTEQIVRLRAEAVLYEHGSGGVTKDGARAAALYCQAARLGDADSQFDLGWMYANGRGVDRNNGLAAFFFNAAAAQGIQQAKNILPQFESPSSTLPECMRTPAKVVAAPERAIEQRPIVAPKAVFELVRKLAPEYRVPLQLVLAIIKAESNFDAAAVSPKNAQGLMQLIPETASRFSVKNAFDPAQNVRGGIAYLRWLLAYFEGDVSLVAAAYNAGERSVERYGGVPPYLETRAYVQRIVAAVGPDVQPFDANVVEPSARMRELRERRSR